MISRFFSKLLGQADGLLPLEKAIVDAVAASLGNPAGQQLMQQLAVMNKVQRLADGKEVNLYQMRAGKAAFDPALLFKGVPEEMLLATVKLAGQQAPLKVKVWVIKGRLFSLTFGKPPREFFAGQNLKQYVPQISGVELHTQPLAVSAVPQTFGGEALQGWLAAWFARGWVSGLKVPLPEAERAALIRRADATLPADYLELLAQTEGAVLGRCTVLGASALREFVGDTDTFVLVAEIAGVGALGVKADAADATLYLLRYEVADEAQPAGSSLQDALQQWMPPGQILKPG